MKINFNKISKYKFYILDNKKIGLFPREKFISKVLTNKGYEVASIYKIAPFHLWSLKSFKSLSSTLILLFFKLLSGNFLYIKLHDYLKLCGCNEKQIDLAKLLLKNSIIDQVNKAQNHCRTYKIKSKILKNIIWLLYKNFTEGSLLGLIMQSGYKIKNIKNVSFVIGDIFYAHETLLTLLLLAGNENKKNCVLTFTGIKNADLISITKIENLRNPIGPFGTKAQIVISNNAKEMFNSTNQNINYPKQIKNNFKLDKVLIYPPCVSDCFMNTIPLTYVSQFDWAYDIFATFKGSSLTIKHHPMAKNYNDFDYWNSVFDKLALRFEVNISYLDSSFKIDEVLSRGYYPLSPKGTVCLELIEFGLPSIILSSNTWSSLFPELIVKKRGEYLMVLKDLIDFDDIFSVLKKYIPNYYQIYLAKSIDMLDKQNDFFYKLGIDKKYLPEVRSGRNHRLNVKEDIKKEKGFLDVLTSSSVIDNCHENILESISESF